MENRSLWRDTVEMPQFPSLEGDIKTDVLIIGGGIAGILTAYFLDKKGANYVLLEQNRICSGTTQNTTAKITLQHGFCYDKMIKQHGLEIAKGYFAANKEAADTYAELCREIDCDYQIRDNYVYSRDNRKKLEKEMEALYKIGCSARLTEDVSVPVKTVGAVCVPNEAQFHPLKFLKEISKNLNIYENTKVREMVGNTAITATGKVSAENVVVTTHFPFINKHGSYFLKLYQHRSYVLALENGADVSGMYVDESDTGLSFRNYNDFLLLGGGGHRTGKKGGAFEELRGFAKKHYPEAKIKYAWATQDCMSLDGIPYIGKYSARTNNMYVASGFNKWGMTGAMVSAKLLRDLIMGYKNEYSEIFYTSRSILRPQLLANGFETTANLLTPTAPRCPHLGCALKWNKNERTWDCSCHGSRFSEKGELLDGPSTAGLKSEKAE